MKDQYIVIDFEANCPSKNSKQHEIIEFPAILVKTESGKIIDEFRHFVKPISGNNLSEFIKDLTHITDTQVENGLTWEKCLKKFEEWCIKNNVNHHTTTIITCGD